ncbi:MAG TPA: LPS export ABC transporter periplasmic protein LptC [Candidatus Binatia bacterium]|jgi:LPS export ABC transporter protein LptC
MRKRRFLLLLAIVASLAGVGYKVTAEIWANKLRDIRENPIQLLDQLPESALSIKDFRRAKVENGRTVWELLGEQASYDKDQRQAVIQKPRFLYYDKKGDVAEASAEIAHVYLNDKELEKMQLEGSIEISYNGYLLKSQEAIYLPAQEQIVMPQRTTLSSEGLELQGSSMEVDLGGSKVRLLRDVKTKLEPEKLAKQKSKSGQS